MSLHHKLNDMKKSSWKYFIFFLSFLGCNGKQKEPPDTASVIHVESGCDSILNIFNSNDLCGKIRVIGSFGSSKSHCIIQMTREFTRITGLDNSLNYGTGGVYYPSDSLLLKDIEYWKKRLNCK
jgi:hypothetical protein